MGSNPVGDSFFLCTALVRQRKGIFKNLPAPGTYRFHQMGKDKLTGWGFASSVAKGCDLLILIDVRNRVPQKRRTRKRQFSVFYTCLIAVI